VLAEYAVSKKRLSSLVHQELLLPDLHDQLKSCRRYRLAVRPEIVLEVAFDSIQKSDRRDSGFALRFPRIKYIRSDKTVNDINTMEKVRRVYERQVHLKSR
jgi:ATP-dependent DNA ligase